MPSAATYPQMPFFVDTIAATTAHLTDAEHGRYLRLMALIWRSPQCRIPNDDAWLARRLGRSAEEIEESFRPLIEEFCRCDGNWITHADLTRHLAYLAVRSKAGSASAKSRKNKGKTPQQDLIPVTNANTVSVGNPNLTYPNLIQDKDIGVGNPPPAPDKYAWSGRVIRLTRRQYDEWKQAYFAITDFSAELRAADDYYTEHPPKDGKWFFAVSNWLKRAHAEALTKPPGSPNGSGGVPWTNVGKGSNWR